MKKSKIKLSLNKKNISNLKINTVKGGMPTGTFCPTRNKCKYTEYNCPKSIWVCDM